MLLCQGSKCQCGKVERLCLNLYPSPYLPTYLILIPLLPSAFSFYLLLYFHLCSFTAIFNIQIWILFFFYVFRICLWEMAHVILMLVLREAVAMGLKHQWISELIVVYFKVSPPQMQSRLIKMTITCLQCNCLFPEGGELTCLLPATENGGAMALDSSIAELGAKPPHEPLCHPVDLRAQREQHYHGNTHTVGLSVSNQLSCSDVPSYYLLLALGSYDMFRSFHPLWGWNFPPIAPLDNPGHSTCPCSTQFVTFLFLSLVLVSIAIL